jgi:ubiquinol-cytochrome c reductase iron-sulfur subunit
MMFRSLGLAVGGLGLAALFPIRSLGPNPGRDLLQTPWHDGVRLITDDGRPVRAEEVPREGLVTVFPEGDPGSADGQAVLIRVAPGLLVPKPGREDWTPQDIVAYSKICPHAGCPVGLYEANRHTLLCPCHQSTFDVLRHAKPQIGPAAAPLPQLPLRIDAQGFLVARGDFSEPVGPSFWHKK